MSFDGSVQVACPRCRTVQTAYTGRATNCHSCGEPLATAAAQAWMGSGVPRVPVPDPGNVVGGMMVRGAISTARRGGGVNKIMVFVIGGLILSSIASFVWFRFKKDLGLNVSDGDMAYQRLGIQPRSADADQLITALDGPARRWESDAVWWALELHYVDGNGKVDLERASASVNYISPERATSYAKSYRNGSIRHFSFHQGGVSRSNAAGPPQRLETVKPPAKPGCSIKQLAGILRTRGLTAGKTVRFSFDPNHRVFVQPDAWHVIGEDPVIDAWYSMADCSHIKG